MMTSARLTIDLRGYWHPGGGRGGGAVLDARTHRNSAGLPALPGRHIKGLLRDALEHAEAFAWAGYEGLAATLFGERPEEAGERPHRPGVLRVGDAELPADLAAWLADGEGRKHQAHLYRNLYATAVDAESGTARDKSLRGIEVVVPLCLSAPITPITGREPPGNWTERLREVLPLIDAVGAHRTRGLGRAVLSLEEMP